MEWWITATGTIWNTSGTTVCMYYTNVFFIVTPLSKNWDADMVENSLLSTRLQNTHEHKGKHACQQFPQSHILFPRSSLSHSSAVK